jgi:ferredoxin
LIARTAGIEDGQSEPTAALPNLKVYAHRVGDDPRYHAAARQAEAPRKGTLALFDCAACNNCTLVCPNGAFFSVALGPVAIDTWDLVVEGGGVSQRPTRFEVVRDQQWALYDGFCNECGNCDPFCPEAGGPFRVKPRLFDSREAFGAAAPGDGILIEEQGRRVAARFGGILHELEQEATGARFSDGSIEVVLDGEHRVSSIRLRASREGHILPLWRYHALRLLCDAVVRGINPLTAPGMPALTAGHAPGSP